MSPPPHAALDSHCGGGGEESAMNLWQQSDVHTWQILAVFSLQSDLIILTSSFARTTERGDFVFYADRLVSNILKFLYLSL